MQILLWFVIPIKMKWMAIVYGVMVLYDMITYLRMGLWVYVVPIIASLLNFVLFFFSTRNMHRYNPKEVHRRDHQNSQEYRTMFRWYQFRRYFRTKMF